MPCWGARERRLFPLCATETTISQCSAVQCSPAHRSLAQPASSPGRGPRTTADQQRGAQSSLTFLLSVAAKKHWERKERGREQRVPLIGGWLMVLLREAQWPLSSLFHSLHPPQL